MDKEQFLKAVASVAEIVCGNENLFGVIEFIGTNSYVSFSEEGAALMFPREGMHDSAELFGKTHVKELPNKLLELVELDTVAKVYETC